MKYLKKFEKSSEYDDFKISDKWVTPNISYIVEQSSLNFQPYVPPPPPPPMLLGEIAYWDGSKVKTVSSDKWSSSLGTPVGVVVIPEGMLPDGKARIISLKNILIDGTPTDSGQFIAWGGSGTDTSLTNYNRVPTTDNAGSTSTGSGPSGYLPSDDTEYFTGTASFVDSAAKYYSTRNLIPSPYLGDNSTFNPEYSKAISGYNNSLSDFNGLTNTQTLVGLDAIYSAANAAWNYTGGVSGTGLQWYLPAMGELGFLVVRRKAINESITAAGGIAVVGDDYFWSSSEYSSDAACYLRMGNGYVSNYNKDNGSNYVRPFAVLA